jgi:dolichol-phosphate mannosyltransferase
MTVSIIIPTRNERGNIRPLLDRIFAAPIAGGILREIIFVDDGSTDLTREEIRSCAGPVPVRLVCRDSETGLASAVLAGAGTAVGDLLVVMDADLSHPPEKLPELLAPLLDGSHDMAIGSRYRKGGATPGWPLSRRLASRLATVPARLFTDVHDPLSGFFAIRRDILLSVALPVTGFKIALHVLATAGGSLRVAEIPIVFVDRACGASKMTGAVIAAYLRQLAGFLGFATGSLATMEPLMLSGIVLALDLFLFNLFHNEGLSIDTGHLLSFLLSCGIGYALTALVSSRPQLFFLPSSLFRYLIILAPFLFIRGAVLALIVDYAPPASAALALPASACAVVAAVAGYLFAAGGNSPLPRNWRATALLVVIFTFFLRLLYLGSFELIQEEAYYWNYSQHLAPGYLDHPPMVALLIWLGTHLFGPTEFGVRSGVFACWLLASLFSWKLAARAFGREAALNAVLLIAVLPFFFGTALFITPDAPLVACWAGTLYFLYRAVIDERQPAWLAAGICLGLGLISKYTVILLVPGILLFMLIDRKSRRMFFSPWPYLAALIAAAVFSPVILWNYQHQWASFLFQSTHRIAAVFQFSTPQLLGATFALLTPTALLAAWTSSRQYLQENLIQPDQSHRHRYWLFTLCTFLPPLAVFLAFSFSKEVKLSWSGPAWLAFLPLIAAYMWRPEKASATGLPMLVTRLWPPTLAALVVVYGLGLHYLSLGLPGIPFRNGTFLFGGDDLAGQVEQAVKQVESERGRSPVVIGMDKYRIASGLAYYRTRRAEHMAPAPFGVQVAETTGRHLFNMESLMYSFWHPPESLAGRDILAISERREYLATPMFSGMGRGFGEIRPLPVKKHGKSAGVFYYRLITGYTPALPEPDRRVAGPRLSAVASPSAASSPREAPL